jgi:hypothetical protein
VVFGLESPFVDCAELEAIRGCHDDVECELQARRVSQITST